jgi:uncharacterized membrane protein YhdT
VWSKVFAAVILAVCGSVLTALYAIFLNLYSQIPFKDTFYAVLQYLNGNLLVPRWLCLVLLIIYIVLIYKYISNLFVDIKNKLFNKKSKAVSNWEYLLETGAYFMIHNLDSNKVIDVAGGIAAHGPPIIVWDSHNGLNQQWKIEKEHDMYLIISRMNGKCLEVEEGGPPNGAKIQLGDYAGKSNQLWQIKQNEGESVLIMTPFSNKCIEADAQFVHQNGGRVIQYDYNNHKHQKWIFRLSLV